MWMVLHDPSEFPLLPGLLMSRHEIKCMVEMETIAEGTILLFKGVVYSVKNNRVKRDLSSDAMHIYKRYKQKEETFKLFRKRVHQWSVSRFT